MIDVCICTHDPRPSLLGAVIDALAAQFAHADAFRVTLIDNASHPPLTEHVLRPLQRRGVAIRLVSESKIGLVHARLRAIEETNASWILFVDDDNVLAPDFIAEGLRFIDANPDVGCFGGRLILPSNLRVPTGCEPFLPFLGIRDLGGQTRKGRSAVWVEYEPPGAGAFVRREVLIRFSQLARERPEVFSLGRAGDSLASCDDALLMSCANDVGLALAYDPALRLEHHIGPERFDRVYLRRLLRAFGESEVMLLRARTAAVSPPFHYASTPAFALVLCLGFAKNMLRSVDFALARSAFHLAARKAFRTVPGH